MMDVLFVCDADAEVGFGHVSRCLKLAALVRRSQPDAQIGFQGLLSGGPRRRVETQMPGLPVLAPGEPAVSRVAVIDRMARPDDAEAVDPVLIDDVRGRCGRIIYVASGATAPKLPEGAICVGYLPGGPNPDPPGLLWGLEYAPVAGETASVEAAVRDPGRALVALGGGRSDAAMTLVAAALARAPEIRTIDVLDSPVRDGAPLAFVARPDQAVSVLRGVSSVAPLLAQAGLVIASYGNLAYEALAVGAPLCLFGQKTFQADFAARLEELGIAIYAGLVGQTNVASAVDALRRTLAGAPRLSARARDAIDGHGLDRLAGLILGILTEARHRQPRVVGVIQARTGSSRLPGKVLMPLAGAPLLQRIVERVGRADRLDAVVVATTTAAADDAIADMCRRMGVACFRGSEHDVLSRVIAAAKQLTADVVVRLTGDNPFVDGALIDAVAGAMLDGEISPAYTHSVDGTGFPPGLSVEAITLAALEEAAARGDADDREHVTLYVRRRPDTFDHLPIAAPGRFIEDAFSIDTDADYARLGPLFERLYRRDPLFTYRDLTVPEAPAPDGEAAEGKI